MNSDTGTLSRGPLHYGDFKTGNLKNHISLNKEKIRGVFVTVDTVFSIHCREGATSLLTKYR